MESATSDQEKALASYKKKRREHREMVAKLNQMRVEQRDLTKQLDNSENDLEVLKECQTVGDLIRQNPEEISKMKSTMRHGM